MSTTGEKNQRVHCVRFPQADAVNTQLVREYAMAAGKPQVERSHYFSGRYENTYVPQQLVPALDTLRDWVTTEAAALLSRPPESIRSGYWFNEMQAGHVTERHNHREDDELLSMVYYIDAPADSGDLLLYQGDSILRFSPEAGMAIFFSPDIDHEVEKNLSGQRRLSIAFNFGPTEDKTS